MADISFITKNRRGGTKTPSQPSVIVSGCEHTVISGLIASNVIEGVPGRTIQVFKGTDLIASLIAANISYFFVNNKVLVLNSESKSPLHLIFNTEADALTAQSTVKSIMNN